MKREPIPQKLRTAIKATGKSVYQVAKDSGVAHPVILRFMSGERDIRLETAEKLAQSLGLELK
jgi:transcriptional regulator with XRE-family HTH domain